MQIVERNMVGKKSQEACEDGIVVTDDFIAVIDGSTSKTPTHLSPDMKNGRYAMVLISEFIRERLKAEASVDDFCQDVSSYIYNKVYKTLGMEERMKLHPEERLTASAIVYSYSSSPIIRHILASNFAAYAHWAVLFIASPELDIELWSAKPTSFRM